MSGKEGSIQSDPQRRSTDTLTLAFARHDLARSILFLFNMNEAVFHCSE